MDSNERTVKDHYANDIEVLANIILSIETHNQIAFQYKKDLEFSKVRKVLAHNIYWNKNEDKVMLDGFQIEGDSKSGVMSFKQFDCKFIESCIILDEKFNVHEKYNPTSDRYNNSILGITK